MDKKFLFSQTDELEYQSGIHRVNSFGNLQDCSNHTHSVKISKLKKRLHTMSNYHQDLIQQET